MKQNYIKISNGLKEMNFYKIDEESVSKSQRRYGATERTNEFTHSQITSNINLLIQLNEPNLTYPNLIIITIKFENKAKREQLVRVTMCDGGELHQAFDTSSTCRVSSMTPLRSTILKPLPFLVTSFKKIFFILF